MVCNTMWGGGIKFPKKKHYIGLRIINIKRGWVGVKLPDKKRYAKLESP